MTTKAQRDFEEMTAFIEAYPFPEYPKKSTSQQQRQIDAEYFRAMKAHGIEPYDVTSMEFNKLMIAELMAKAFPG